MNSTFVTFKQAVKPFQTIYDKFTTVRNNSQLDETAGESIHAYTRNFLEQYKDKLTPDEKGSILENYISLWRNCKFHSADGKYDAETPKLTGFNLQNADFYSLAFCYLKFEDVNFQCANFSSSVLSASEFINCNLCGASASKFGNLGGNKFIGCDLTKVRFEYANLWLSTYKHCKLDGAWINTHELQRGVQPLFDDCSGKPVFPKHPDYFYKSEGVPSLGM